MMIDTDFAQLLEDAAEDAGVQYTFTYSGRGMYGAECFAIYGKANDLAQFLRVLDEDTADDLSDPRTDNMGLDLVFYWPSLKTKGSKWL